MRLLSSFLALLTVLFLSSAAFAQDADIQWKDLSAGERQGILNTWRSLPQDEKGPFILYREETIKNLSAEKKAKYADTAKARAEREKSSAIAYEKRQAEEEKRALEIEKVEDIAKPVVPTIEAPKAVKSLETKPIEAAKPAEVAEPAVMNAEQKTKEDASAAEKAKELLNKFF